MTLALYCAHCEFPIDDPFEVLPTDKIAAMTCERCGHPFWFVIAECARCANDVVRCWKSTPPPDALNKLVCDGCGRPARLECDDDSEIYSAPCRR